MAKINNAQVIQKLVDELKLYPSKDAIPTELAEKILPVFQINSEEITVKTPTANIVKAVDINFDGGTSNTVYTVPATGKFYLTGFMLSMSNGTAAAYNSCKLNIDIDGTTVAVGQINLAPRITTVGDAVIPYNVVSISLPNPILLDQASTIDLVTENDDSYTSANIYGYTEAD